MNIIDVFGRLLLQKGAYVNAKAEHDMSALHFAAANGFADVASVLVDREADINAKDSRGIVPIHLAAENGHDQVVK